MALLSIDYYSCALMRSTTLEAIVPFDDEGEAHAADRRLKGDPGAWDSGAYPAAHGPFKALFLLHGVSGNQMDWITRTRIRRFAEQRRIAVFMPAGHNAFYLDHAATHEHYGQLVGKELVNVARRVFPISDRREDTFIGGVSMGAYGALVCGLRNCETFGSIVSLSSAMIVGGLDQVVSDDPFFLSRPFLEATFGDLSSVRGSDRDPVRLAADLVYCDRPRPRVLVVCGNRDPLVEANRVLARDLGGIGLDVTWREGEGGHDWDFWDAQLPGALDWLPLG